MSVRVAALWSMSAQYLAFAIQFVTSIALARYFLNPTEVGLFSVAFSAAMMVSVLQDFGITRYIAGERDLSDQQVRTCFSVSLLFAFAIALILFAIAWPVARFYEEMKLLPLLLVIAASYLLVPFAIVPGALLQREMDFKSVFAINVGAAVANSAVALGLAAAGWSAMALAWGAFAQQAARALIGFWRSKRAIPFPLSLGGAQPILRFGSGSSVLAVSGVIGIRSPELIIGRLITMEAVGLWARAAGLAGQLRLLVSGAIAGVFYPAFARLRDQGEDLAHPYARVVSGYSAVTWPAMAFLAVAAPPLVLILYGSTWAEVVPVLFWLALSEAVFAALPLHTELPILLGRMRRLIILNLVDTAISIGLLLVASYWGVEWAAISRLGYALVWFVLYAGLIRALIGFRWRDILPVYLQSLAATLSTVAPLLLVYWYQGAPAAVDFPTLAATALIGCLLWLATLFLVRHPVRHEVLGLLATARAGLARRAAEPI